MKSATDSGYAVNHEDKRGRPAKIALGHAMPADETILPERERLAECCSVAVLTEGINHPSPPSGPSASISQGGVTPVTRVAPRTIPDGEPGDDRWTR